jgi:hypothetical protein
MCARDRKTDGIRPWCNWLCWMDNRCVSKGILGFRKANSASHAHSRLDPCLRLLGVRVGALVGGGYKCASDRTKLSPSAISLPTLTTSHMHLKLFASGVFAGVLGFWLHLWSHYGRSTRTWLLHPLSPSRYGATSPPQHSGYKNEPYIRPVNSAAVF